MACEKCNQCDPRPGICAAPWKPLLETIDLVTVNNTLEWSQLAPALELLHPTADYALLFRLDVVGAVAGGNPVTLDTQAWYEIPGGVGLVPGFEGFGTTNNTSEMVGVYRDEVISYRTEVNGAHQWLWPRYEQLIPGYLGGVVIPATRVQIRYRLRDTTGTASAKLWLKGWAP